ncbi:thiamine-phosphate pyrophosphorylase [Anaerosphaera aminiphila DSM 21120]|uniref:Thiamine-phosphate synthase n=1 Tax=Anaerosphaera aminiphila DSM 21120 TaxID=1120995 RepID=A0A1M5RWI0_9FIRM|nr:thiamine phosphate synthase [Anaerosphaera aminiphila]SHH30697.1 thiamine-phosphate pyrophosphorylase [Anaerosphaera aminiphila DSM 21120]
MKNFNLSVYLVTDNVISSKSLPEAVEQSILGGATVVQLREKNLSSKDFLREAFEVKHIADKYHIPLIINDRIDIALCVDAAGVHLGQSDIDILNARKILGEDKIIGISVTTVEQALEAEKNGADYLGAGALFSTPTKDDAKLCSLDELRKIISSVDIPVVGIGGLNETTIPKLKNFGLAGYAVVSAILSKKDIKSATENIKKMYDENEILS